MARPPPSTHRTAAATPDGAAIAEAALRVLHEGGPQALSFRRVAALLGTSHMTVHRHCHNVDGLLDLCADHLAATLPEIDPALPWAEATEQRFTGLYDLMSAHSSLVALQRGRPWLGLEMMSRFAEPALAASLAAGLTLDEMIRSHRTFYMFTVGCALTRDTYDVVRDRGALDELDPGLTPVLAASRDRIEVEHEPRHDYVRGLRALIAAAEPSGACAGSAAE
jgi:AcrR family transcriptional regulator